MTSPKSEHLQFDILILNTHEQPVIKSELNLLHSILSNSLIWEDPKLIVDDLLIVDGNASLDVRVMDIDAEADADNRKAFLVGVKANYHWLEPKRKKILEFLRTQGFEHIHILVDQVSERIACRLYPSIYRLENALRAYISKFMVSRVGTRWWENISTNELRQKVIKRKNNEREFKDYIDNNTYLIDFGDLGRLIYAHSLGFKSKEDIIRKISELEETPEAIRQLKEDLKSNYQKFFKKSFKDRNFQSKWEELEKIRHKVAHNNLFIHSDFEKAQNLSSELSDIIKSASLKIDEATLSLEEREAIKESVVEAIQASESKERTQRLLKATQSLTPSAIDTTLTHPATAAVIAALKGYLDS